MEITRKMLVELRSQIDEALLPIAEKYQVSIKSGSASYGGLSGSIKLLLETQGENGETKESQEWNQSAQWNGMRTDWLGKTIEVDRVAYKITGFNRSRRKYPIAVVRLHDNKKYFMPIIGIRLAMIQKGIVLPYHHGDNLGTKE